LIYALDGTIGPEFRESADPVLIFGNSRQGAGIEQIERRRVSLAFARTPASPRAR
jgi:hypothetical protein